MDKFDPISKSFYMRNLGFFQPNCQKKKTWMFPYNALHKLNERSVHYLSSNLGCFSQFRIIWRKELVKELWKKWQKYNKNKKNVKSAEKLKSTKWQNVGKSFKNVVKKYGDIEKIKNHDIFDQTPRYRYCNDTVVLTIAAFTTYLHNGEFR